MTKRISQLLAIALVVVLALALTGCGKKAADTSSEPGASAEQPTEQPPADQPATDQPATTDPGTTEGDVTELKIEDLKVGTGAVAGSGSVCTVHYTGWLTDGTKFDSSVDRGQPFQFQIGAGRVIAGWEQGVAGMKVGGKRKLTIPPALGYGDVPNGPIPAGSTLVFEVELLNVQ